MKLFHLSDLHIGLKLLNRDLLEDQRYILGQIVTAASREKPDAVVVAGDIYDKAVPPAEAVSLFDDFIFALRRAAPDAEIMLISGNHDSAPRLNLFRGLLGQQRIHMIGLPPQRPGENIERVTLQDEWGPVHFYLLPFIKPSMVRAIVCGEREEPSLSYDEAVRRLIARESIDESERNVLVSHQFYLPADMAADQVERADSEICTIGNIDQVSAEALIPFDYAALGHIHKPMIVDCDRHRYSGTPLACSVSEAGQQKAVIMVELGEKGRVDTRLLPLTPLRQLRVERGTLEEVIQRGSDDYVSVALTDKAELDVMDMRDRLTAAFPNLLEIRRETLSAANYDVASTAATAPELDPLELCRALLGDMNAEEEALLRDIINAVKEAN